MIPRAPKAWSTSFDRATTLLAWVGGLCLMFMMVLITASVTMRHVVGQPLLGVNEVV